MFTNMLFIVLSGPLLVYWFRYTCLLILNARTVHDYASELAAANGLTFPSIEVRLAAAPQCGRELDSLARELDRDYRNLMALMQHVAEFRAAGRRLEHRLLLADYHVMRACYSACKRLSLRHCRGPLQEMALIVRHLADAMGESTYGAAEFCG